MNFWRFILCLVALLTNLSIQANTTPLPIDQAFQFSAIAKDYQTVVLNWDIAPGYYLYKNKFKISAVKPKNLNLPPPVLPLNETVENIPSVGKLTVYSNNIYIIQPVLSSKLPSITLHIHYQGCSSSGFCYPPVNRVVTLNMQGNFGSATSGINLDSIIKPHLALKQTTKVRPKNYIENILQSGHEWQIVIGFLIFGILIAFTPCVLPMVPILSSIIVGQGKISHTRSFLLSLAYVLGMAITYAIAGVAFGYIGGSLQVAFQKPWIITTFTLIFIAMALSLFDLYTIQLPNKLRSRLASAGEHQKHGTLIGVFFMGVFSTLVMSPCVTPPLVAVLTFISQSGKAVLGGIALFSMGLGMGLPLLIIGSAGPKLLPHTGKWMITIKHFLGVMLLAVAISLISRLIPAYITMILWSLLAISYATNLGAFKTSTGGWGYFRKSCALLLFVYGILLSIGAIQGQTSPLKPINLQQKPQQELFTPVKSIDDIYKQLANPTNQGKPVIVDFYADWCVACHEMDNRTFNQPRIQQALQRYVRLRADVTHNTIENKLLMQHFSVVAPPTMIMFDKQHNLLPNKKIIGFIDADNLKIKLKNI